MQRRIHGDDDARFWSKVDKEAPDGCWLWTGTPGRLGYATIKMGGRDGRNVLVHRWSYERCVGPIPTGLDLDHKCHTESETCLGGKTCLHRLCVNPEHLEPVTERENSIRSLGPSGINHRKTHCIRGHEFSEENTRIVRGGGRSCRACARMHLRAWRKRVAEAEKGAA